MTIDHDNLARAYEFCDRVLEKVEASGGRFNRRGTSWCLAKALIQVTELLALEVEQRQRVETALHGGTVEDVPGRAVPFKHVRDKG